MTRSGTKKKISDERQWLLWQAHDAPKKLCISEDDRRSILMHLFRVESSRNLTNRQLNMLLDYFASKGWEDTRGGFGRRPGMATPAQIRKIYALWWSLGGNYYQVGKEFKALRGFLKKRFRVEHENFLSFEAAGKVIEAIKKIGVRGVS